MNFVRFLLPMLLLTFGPNVVHAQSKDKPDQTRGKAGGIRQADPRHLQAPPATASERARQRRSAEEQARAERFPPRPRSKLP